MFSRIQNLHISQTQISMGIHMDSLVEFKIYISLKPEKAPAGTLTCLVEFKIYISLKRIYREMTKDSV